MTGETHAATGVVLGFGLAALAGLPAAEAVLVAVTIGPVTRLLSWLLTRASAVAFRATRTVHDRPSAGTHRHLSHTIVFGLLLGAAAQWTAALSPWAVAGWVGFGLLAAGAALREWVALAGAAAAAAPVVLDHAGLYAVCASAQHWIGLAVAAGCLAHIAGDALTVSGVPMLWPLPLGRSGQRQTWRELHLLPAGFRLHTGKRVERWLVLPLVLAGCVLAAPGVAPHLAAWVGSAAHLASSNAAGGAR
jgi:membrane-bound metal-dependent hydrolase YbcI (DUF457 family)